MIVVSDTSSLCGLGIVGHLLLLQQIYGQVLIPSAGADELKGARIIRVLQRHYPKNRLST